MVVSLPQPPEHQIVTSLVKEDFDKEEICKIKTVVVEKLGKPGITPDEKVAAFIELKGLNLSAAARVDAEMLWPVQLHRKQH